MTVLDLFIAHTAGPPVGWVQRCTACGAVLLDNTAWAEDRVAVMEGDGRGPSWWPAGARIATNKTGRQRVGMAYVVDADRPLADDERLCSGIN